MSHRTSSQPVNSGSFSGAIIRRFALAGSVIGLCLGLLEAGLFYWIPRASGLLKPDTTYVVWFLAVLVDLISGLVLGIVFGFAASALALGPSTRKTGVMVLIPAALGWGIAGAYFARLLTWFGIGAGSVFPRRLEARTPAEWFVAVSVASLIVMVLARRGKVLTEAGTPRHHLAGLALLIVAGAVSIGGIVFCATHRPFGGSAETSAAASRSAASSRANVALIVLDTVRADHLSCYGYARPTTPNLDRLAARGVLFENAVAPSSWTLPSIVSILTGLAPHQSGADWGRTLDAAPWTLARILASKGYETAGFNANPFYGLAGWRLSEGFSIYDDDAAAIRHNLAVTFVGQSLLRGLYNRLVRYNQFDHRDAGDLNRDIRRWARRRNPSKPYFLFVNYMDAHRPYLPPAPFDHRFGRIPRGLLARLTQPLNNGHPRKPYTSRDRRDLVDGYDNSLAYLDVEVERLIDFLRRAPGGDHTIFIVTSDHGEGFGEHGTYDHGWNLYGEVLRVPLIVAGAGVPSGRRVPAVVASRAIFSTVLDLTLGLEGPAAAAALGNYWKPGAPADASREAVVSELNIFSQGADPAMLSLTTAEWRLILSSGGRAELYHWPGDPQEARNLAGDPSLRDTLAKIESALESRVAYSLLPWRDLDYLSPLNRGRETFVQEISQKRLKLAPAGIPVGSAQAVFSGQPPSQLVHPPPEQRGLRTLPYH